MKWIEHFNTITKHKLLVMKYCFSVGLYRQGLLHHLSKYAPTEFFIGAKYYQGTRSPNNAEKEEKGYSRWAKEKEMKEDRGVVHVTSTEQNVSGAGIPLINNGKEMSLL